MPTLKRLQLASALLHLSIVLFWIYVVDGSRDGPMLWLMFLLYDFPVGFGWSAINSFLRDAAFFNYTNQFGNYILPPLYFGIVGTIWWYFVPAIIYKLYLFGKSFLYKLKRWANKT